MKYIIKRSGSYTETTYISQEVQVDARSMEEADELARSDVREAGVRLIDGDRYGWTFCADADVEEVADARTFYDRRQFAFAARYAPVFDHLPESGK
jgi:hypothetical protein